jgi:hypothetical protein
METDLHGDALSKIMGDMDDMETQKMNPNKGGATITITVTPSTYSSDEGGGEGAEDLPADHDESMCGGGCAYHKGGIISAEGETGINKVPMLSDGGEVLEQLAPDHDAIACKGKCPAHKFEKSGAMGKKGLSMAGGGQVPGIPVPAEVDDTRIPPFLRKKKGV